LKGVLVRVAGLNLSLLMRTIFGVGKPRCLQGKGGLLAALLAALIALWTALVEQWARLRQHFGRDLSRPRDFGGSPGRPEGISPVATIGAFTTA
jgi:hypothetical protein